MKDIKWAVLGTGVIANEMAQALIKKGKSIYSVANRTHQKAVEFAKKYNINKVYEDMKDMIAKVQFYLEHEELRKRIAHNGYLKVCEMFRFDDRIKYMLEIADEK